jgi:hypothetical protein
MEPCLDATREMQMVVANRICVDGNYTRQLIRQEAAHMRLIHASHRELLLLLC